MAGGGGDLSEGEHNVVLMHENAGAGGDEDGEPVTGAKFALHDLLDHGGAGGGEAEGGCDIGDLVVGVWEREGRLHCFQLAKQFCHLPNQHPARKTMETHLDFETETTTWKKKKKKKKSRRKISTSTNWRSGCGETLPLVLHLTIGPISRLRSRSLDFTHLLHSRYCTKEDLVAYFAHLAHVSVTKEFVLPVCDDIMVVNWEADLNGLAVPPVGLTMHVTRLKLKEGLGDEEKGKAMSAFGGIKGSFWRWNRSALGRTSRQHGPRVLWSDRCLSSQGRRSWRRWMRRERSWTCIKRRLGDCWIASCCGI